MGKEYWLPVVGYEQYYEVSNHGQVRRIGKGRGIVTNRILKQWQTRKEYRTVSLYNGYNHKVTARVHRLVARTFIGQPPVGKTEIRHLDGDPKNNNVVNLAWGNNVENKMDIIRHGRSTRPLNSPTGDNHAGCKIKDMNIPKILELLKIKTQVDIAKIFDVSQSTISAIKNGRIRKSDRTPDELENSRRLKIKHRKNCGEQHPMSKLTKNKVEQIREMLTEKTQKEIAKQFGISQSTVNAIKTNKLWKYEND